MVICESNSNLVILQSQRLIANSKTKLPVNYPLKEIHCYSLMKKKEIRYRCRTDIDGVKFFGPGPAELS